MYKNKISAVYQIVNTVTGDSYVGSSKNIKHRWEQHKWPSTWKEHSNSPMYQDIQKYGLENFRFQILAPVEPEYLTQVEQEFIEMLHPTYNSNRANGFDVKRRRERQRKYNQSEIRQEYNRKYHQSNKCKESNKKYNNQLCSYNGEELTLRALVMRFFRTGINHPTLEAKKYLIKEETINEATS